MPSIARITNTFFVTLINRLGIRPPPIEGFEISSVVTPVSIVDADIIVPVVPTTIPLDIPATAGLLVAPVANTLLADTGALPAGVYNMLIVLSTDGQAAGTPDPFVERRNAANSAGVWSFPLCLNQSNGFLVWAAAIRLLLNERVRVTALNNFPAALGVQVNIWSQLVQ